MDEIITSLESMFPDAHCELNHTSNFELLVAVMLSAQTTDVSVNKLTKSLFKKYRGPEDFANANLADLENDLKQIGLYKNKAKNVQNMSKLLIEKFNAIVPNNLVDLMSLPGVGRKTANVVLSVAFNIPSFAVDTHVERVSKRLNIAHDDDNVLTVEKKLTLRFPKESWNKLHHQMIFFGRYHCTSRNPKCHECPLTYSCNYYKNIENKG